MPKAKIRAGSFTPLPTRNGNPATARLEFFFIITEIFMQKRTRYWLAYSLLTLDIIL